MIDFREAIQDYEEEVLTRQIILSLLNEYKRPNDKINELVKKGELSALKKGLYIPGPNTKIRRPERFLIANHLWGPSYVSLDTALSYWGLIPERVFEVSSVTIKASKSYQTELGKFSYTRATIPYYSFGICSVQLTAKQAAMIASPEKAICDKIVMTSGMFLRSPKQTQELLLDDLRMDEEKLRSLDFKKMHTWLPHVPKKASLGMLIKTLKAL